MTTYHFKAFGSQLNSDSNVRKEAKSLGIKLDDAHWQLEGSLEAEDEDSAFDSIEDYLVGAGLSAEMDGIDIR